MADLASSDASLNVLKQDESDERDLEIDSLLPDEVYHPEEI